MLLRVCPCLHLMTQQFAHFETDSFWGHTHEDQVMVRTHALEGLHPIKRLILFKDILLQQWHEYECRDSSNCGLGE